MDIGHPNLAATSKSLYTFAQQNVILCSENFILFLNIFFQFIKRREMDAQFRVRHSNNSNNVIYFFVKLLDFVHQNLCTVGIRIPNIFSIQMVQTRPVDERFGFQMPSEYQTFFVVFMYNFYWVRPII